MNLTAENGLMLHKEFLVLQDFQEQIHLVADENAFQEKHGFTLRDYLNNRREFSTVCQEHADHLEKFAKGSGIAKTVGGSVTVVSGGLAILGVILSPFTVGASLGLTIGGIAGGIVGSGTTIGATIAKDRNILSVQKKIVEALKTFEHQDKVVSTLLKGVKDNVKNISEIIKKYDNVLRQLETARVGAFGGIGLIIKGIKLGDTISIATKFASIADDIAVISVETAGRTAVAAGSTTAKVLSGIFAGVGILFGAYDIYSGVKDIKGSEIAEKFRKFAKEYDEETRCLENQIFQLTICSLNLDVSLRQGQITNKLNKLQKALQRLGSFLITTYLKFLPNSP